jgi:hypothetical protein
MQAQRINDSLDNLLRNLPPAVAARVQEKYDRDRTEFTAWLQTREQPKTAAEWAKRSCTKCHGRGIIGTLTKPSGEQVVPACPCTEKNYRAWLKTQREIYNARTGTDETT